MKKDKVSYDANFSIEEHRGMGKYINNFISVLDKSFNLERLGLLKADKQNLSSTYFSFGFSNYILWEQFSLKKYSEKFKGLIFFPYNTAPLFLKPTSNHVLIVHDLIFLKSYKTKSLKQKIGKLYRRFLVPRIVKKFEHVITVSEYSRRELVNEFNLQPDKITVIPNSIFLSPGYSKENISFEDRENYIFHIGGEPEYKNTKAILYAFHGLENELKEKYCVKIIGIRDQKTLEEYKVLAEELNILSNLEFLPYQTDSQIEELYKHAKMFIFPSFDEGFGIPLIEALSFGCPLICSDTSCFPEIAGEAAHYFDPKSPVDLTKAIMSVINSPEQSNQKISLGYQQVNKYSNQIFSENVERWFTMKFNTQ